MGKKLKLILFVLLPIICLVIAGIPFTLADYPETPIEQTMNGTSAEDTGASTADKSLKGGALYISGGATYTMTGGSITGKTNQYGGAVYVTNGSTFTMTGGTITGCSALYGGAIYVEAGGTCNITGGTITGNKAQFAPAIYVEDGATLNVDQTAVIKDNEYGRYGNALEIYVDGTLAKTMYMKADTYTINEADMPLQYENCCGYFLNEELTKTIKNDVVDLSNGDVNVYTRTADSSLFTFTTDGADGYIITKNSSVSYSGTEFNLVMPREYENKTVTTIADRAFFGVFENCDLINIVFSSEIKTIAKKCFDADEGDSPCVINELNIHDNIETIDDYAFAYCEGIGQLILPDSLKTIGIHAFRACTGLTGNLILPNSITKINEGSFLRCENLTGELIIPNSVVNIGHEAFYGCLGFSSLTLSNTLSSLGNYAFYECSGFSGVLVLPDSLRTIGMATFAECSGFSGLTIPVTVTSIGVHSFYNCSGLTGELIIPNSVTSIGDAAFYNCSKLTSLTIGNNVTSIGTKVFANCSSFTGNLTIPNSVTSIGDSAFSNCRNLTSLTIGNGVASITKLTFSYCSGLESIYIPSSITTISYSGDGTYPLYGCSSSLVIYTDVANASSKPSGWGTYWNYYSSSGTLTVNYGYTLEQYKSAVGLTFAPNEEKISEADVEMIENINAYQVDGSYLKEDVLDKKDYILLKKQEKIAQIFNI